MSELFLACIRPHWRRLHAVAGRYAADKQRAEDLVQETLLRAWRNFSPNEERTFHGAWLFTIMRNIVLEWHRSAAAKLQLDFKPGDELTQLLAAEQGEPFARLPALDETQFMELLDERLARAFAGLDPAHREVLLLSVAGDLNYREIAEVLDCPIGTVMSRVGRARRQLREELGEVFVRETASRRPRHDLP